MTDQHSELTSIIDTLKSEVTNLHTVKNSNNETWTNYIQEIIKSCKKLTGECHSLITDQGDAQNANDLKKEHSGEMDKLEGMVRSKAIMEQVMNDKKKEVMTSQGRERTNVIRINQLVKDIDGLNSNLKEVGGRIDGQETEFESRKKEQEIISEKLSELRLREKSLKGDNVSMNVT